MLRLLAPEIERSRGVAWCQHEPPGRFLMQSQRHGASRPTPAAHCCSAAALVVRARADARDASVTSLFLTNAEGVTDVHGHSINRNDLLAATLSSRASICRKPRFHTSPPSVLPSLADSNRWLHR
jgi:hypothetical protein